MAGSTGAVAPGGRRVRRVRGSVALVTFLRLATAVRSHPGLVREQNEDAVLATPRLAMVADGVGWS